ncbi:MAG: glycosyltransferase family 4 protein [Phycisphaerales bacterium]|nr:glycosyltransferase family 4 protein [Phycisphaerales bacterium]
MRLVTSAQEALSLTLGPVQVTVYDELNWLMRSRRMRRLLDLLAERPPSVVHAMSAGSYGVAEAVAVEYDADLIYQITAVEDLDAVLASTHTGLRRVVCASAPLRERYLAASGAAPEQVALIRPGVVCAEGPTCFLDDEREPTVLSTADLLPGTGVDRLIEAVHLLHSRGYRFLTFLLGAGPEEHRLRLLVKERGLTSCVVFAQPEGATIRAMVGADVFIQPGAEQALSARTLQALGQGMAVIGVRGGVHDAYIADQTALVVEHSSAGTLADAMARLLDDHALARRLAEGAIAHMKAQHTMSAMVQQTVEVYRAMALHRATFPINR